MDKDPTSPDHLDWLRNTPGPTISGKIIIDSTDRISLMTRFGIYEILLSDVHSRSTMDDVTHVTLTRGAKIVFSRLVDAESLMVRSKANLAQMAQNAKQLHSALHKALGQPRFLDANRVASEDCPMCDCVDCCECPVVDCGDDRDGDDRDGGDSIVASKYYDEKSGRSEGGDYRQNK